MYIHPVVLEGERVQLLPLKKEDTQELFEAGKSPNIWKYMPVKINSLADMEKHVNKIILEAEQGTTFPFTIFDKKSNKIVGSTRFLNISISNYNLEIGTTWLSPEVWRTRVNTECKYLLLKHCFEKLGTIRVQFKTDSRNLKSQKAINRLGAKTEGVIRKHMIMPDRYLRSSIIYSIVSHEWLSVKTKLENFLKKH